MTSCDRWRDDIAALLYDDLDPETLHALEAHIISCAGCREERRGLQRTVLNLRSRPPETFFPREKEVDWDAFARSTVQRATGFRSPAPAKARGGAGRWLEGLRLSPAWAGAAAALLIIIGAAAGTFGVLALRPAPVPAAAPEYASRPAALPAEMLLPTAMLADIERSSAREGTRRYLSESRALLVSLLGAPVRCEKDTMDIKDERVKSLELIRRQRLIADDLESLPLSRAQDICRDLERLFLEIASLGDCARSEQIRELRDLVERRRLLLRLDLVADEMKGASNDV